VLHKACACCFLVDRFHCKTFGAADGLLAVGFNSKAIAAVKQQFAVRQIDGPLNNTFSTTDTGCSQKDLI